MMWFRLVLLPAILGLGVLALTPLQADAQKGGGGRPSGAPSMGPRPGGPSPAYRPGVNYAPNYAPYRGYGYGLGYPYSGININIGVGGYNSLYSPYGYGTVRPLYYDSFYPPSAYSLNLFPPPSIVPAEPVSNEARVEVRLPVADAVVTLNGDATKSTGSERFFITPTLEPGYSYSYQIVATWTQAGEQVRVERTIQVAPGRTTLVDFTRANTEPRMPPVEP